MTALYACVHVAEFPAQALLRLRPDLRKEPVVVFDGRSPDEFVCSLNTAAQQRGAALGMNRMDVEALPGILSLARSPQAEAAVRLVLLEIASRFSPRIEDTSNNSASSFVLDISGSERLFGPPARMAERIRAALTEASIRASIAVSTNFHAACMKAAACRGIHVIPDGHEAATIARLPITALSLSNEHRDVFALWGINTLGELAALPEADLISRLGQPAHLLRQAALGTQPHLFQPIAPEFTLYDYFAFETPVEEIDSLLFLGARMIDSLVTRATDRALSLARLTVHMKLDGGQSHEVILRPAIPSADRKFLLKLLQLEIGAHPPQAAVMALEITAEAGQSGNVQLGLFTPQTPEPSRLDVTLARLRSLVGDDRVGSPVLLDTHRPGSFHMQALALNPSVSDTREPQRAVIRRMRPPLPVRVILSDNKPASFSDPVCRFSIKAAYGPWKASGSWWSPQTWDVEEWDVLAVRADGTSVACLLVCDPAHSEWQLEAVYD